MYNFVQNLKKRKTKIKIFKIKFKKLNNNFRNFFKIKVIYSKFLS